MERIPRFAGRRVLAARGCIGALYSQSQKRKEKGTYRSRGPRMTSLTSLLYTLRADFLLALAHPRNLNNVRNSLEAK